jgi:hypothetical protein
MIVRQRFLGRQITAYGLLVFGVCLGAVAGEAAEFIVTDQANGRVVALDATTGAVTRTLVSGLIQPSAISWGPAAPGDDFTPLFVTDLVAGTVIKINPATGANSVFVSGIDKPGSVHFDDATDTLFVGEFGDFQTFSFGDEIFSYSATGTLIPSQTINAFPTGHSGLTSDSQGNLYVSGFATDGFASGHVLKYSSPSQPNPLSPLGIFAPATQPSPLLQGAAGLAFDTAGNLFVAGLISGNPADGALVKFTVTDGVVTGEETFDADIAFPSGMTVLPDGSLVVTSLGGATSPGTLYKYNTTTGDRVDLLAGGLVGNFDGDADVDGDDLAAWKTAFTAGEDSADADGDGDSDGDDFLAWQRGVGSVATAFSPSGVVYYEPVGAGVSGSVPEPSAGLMAAMGILAVGRRWRLRRTV